MAMQDDTRLGSHRTRERRDDRVLRDRGGGEERLAQALGWFSIGLGIAEVAAPTRSPA